MLNAFWLNMNRLQSVLYREWNPPLLLLELFSAASHSFLNLVSRLSMLLGNCDASSVTKQHFKSNPVQSHLSHWEKWQKMQNRQQCFKIGSFFPGLFHTWSFQCKLNIFSLFEVSFSAKVHRFFLFLKVGMERWKIVSAHLQSIGVRMGEFVFSHSAW